MKTESEMYESVRMVKKRKRRIRSRDDSRKNEADKCVNEVKNIGEQLRAFILGESAKVSKAACEVIINKIGEYESVLNKLLCKNERLKGALAVYERIGLVLQVVVWM